MTSHQAIVSALPHAATVDRGALPDAHSTTPFAAYSACAGRVALLWPCGSRMRPSPLSLPKKVASIISSIPTNYPGILLYCSIPASRIFLLNPGTSAQIGRFVNDQLPTLRSLLAPASSALQYY